ncbi:hypothetical protein V3C99_006705 [Haemonchus contortus]
MACKAVHSHLLLGLMILHAIIIEYLFVSDMYLLYPVKVPASSGSKNASSSEEPKLDLNGIKVVVGIGAHIVCLISLIGALLANNISAVARILPPIVVIVILIFTLAFNVPAAICLLLHEAPKHPGGFSRAVRFSMILSFTTIAYSLVVIVVFCVCKPGHESLRPVGGPISSRQQQSRDGDEKRSKEQVEEKRSVERKVKHSSGTSPTENKGDMPSPAPPPARERAPPPPPPPPPPAPSAPDPTQIAPSPEGADAKKESDGLYENLEVPQGFGAAPPPPPPP